MHALPVRPAAFTPDDPIPVLPDGTIDHGRREVYDVAPGVVCVPIPVAGVFIMVNAFMVGDEDDPDGPWTMVDAGLGGSAACILAAAEAVHGRRPPEAIVLTHAHFDHVGALGELAEAWDVPVYIHRLELAYVTGRAALPPYDPTPGGFTAHASRLFPTSICDVGGRARVLPADHSVPTMPGWRWVFTPGHTPGHVALFRESDRTALVADALITMNQESAVDSLSLRPVIHGPPVYATYDWPAAASSARRIADLEPYTLATGHGEALRGPGVADDVRAFADQFEELAVPPRGRYVGDPGRFDESGPRYVPPPMPDVLPKIAAGVGIAALAAAALLATSRQREGRA